MMEAEQGPNGGCVMEWRMVKPTDGVIQLKTQFFSRWSKLSGFCLILYGARSLFAMLNILSISTLTRINNVCSQWSKWGRTAMKNSPKSTCLETFIQYLQETWATRCRVWEWNGKDGTSCLMPTSHSSKEPWSLKVTEIFFVFVIVGALIDCLIDWSYFRNVIFEKK